MSAENDNYLENKNTLEAPVAANDTSADTPHPDPVADFINESYNRLLEWVNAGAVREKIPLHSGEEEMNFRKIANLVCLGAQFHRDRAEDMMMAVDAYLHTHQPNLSHPSEQPLKELLKELRDIHARTP